MIHLTPMTAEEFEAYFEPMLAEYASDHVRSGTWSPDEALDRAQAQGEQLLPRGMESSNHHFFSLQDEASGERVGILWLFTDVEAHVPRIFIYDIVIHEHYRRRGYASQTLQALEAWARAREIGKISLHVFGHNRGAIKLYEKMGFIVTDLQMSKQVV